MKIYSQNLNNATWVPCEYLGYLKGEHVFVEQGTKLSDYNEDETA